MGRGLKEAKGPKAQVQCSKAAKNMLKQYLNTEPIKPQQTVVVSQIIRHFLRLSRDKQLEILHAPEVLGSVNDPRSP